MTEPQTYLELPPNLPVPVDDGAAVHLPGTPLPSLRLRSTRGLIDLGALPPGRSVIFAYPMTGKPGVALPDGWDLIPGARGCTPQNCAFRDAHAAFVALGVSVFGLSAQSPEDQLEAATRLHLPFPLISDAALELAQELRLPTFAVAGRRLLRRLTLIVSGGLIEDVLYPVFPPTESAAQTLAWLAAHPR